MGFRFLIHPPGWALAESHISHELVPFAESPVVALSRFEEGRWRYFERGSLDKHEIDEALEEATAYLNAQDTTWEVEETSRFLGLFKRPTRASATGGVDLDLLGKGPTDRIEYGLTMKVSGVHKQDDFTPERVLSPTTMRNAAEKLKSSTIMVIIPKRGVLIAAPGGPTDVPAVVQWANSAKNYYADPEGPEIAICPHVFFVQDGQIVGCNLAQPDGSFALSLSKTDPEDWYV